MWSIVVQEGTTIVIFFIFEYGVDYGATCIAESSLNSISWVIVSLNSSSHWERKIVFLQHMVGRRSPYWEKGDSGN